MKFSRNILGVVLVTLAAVILTELCQASEFVSVFGIFGAFSFFMGPYFTGSGFFVRGHYVDAPTPGCVWRLLGVVVWIIALVMCFVTMQIA